MNNTLCTLNTNVINPPQTPVGSVIWMHGLGANNHDFDSLIPLLTNHHALPLRFIFPNAPIRPVSINHHMPMPAWYDVFSLTDLNREDVAGIRQSQEAISQLIQQEIDNGVPANRIVLAGFSQGGAMALYTGMRQLHKIGGILGLSCYLPLIHEHENTIHPANLETPILITHGTQDMTLPHFLGKMGHDMIIRTHKNVRWKDYAMQHEITPQETADIHHWLLSVFA